MRMLNCKFNKNLQFAAPHHVCNDQRESMATERQENTGLIKYTPHFLGDIILHIFPSINTWIVVGVSLLKENQLIAMNM